MATQLAKRIGGSGTVVSVDVDNLNPDVALGALSRAMSKAGLGSGGGGGKRVAPGDTYQFKKGWKKGTGKKAVDIDPPRFVVNVPHMGLFYQKFELLDGGKYKVHTSEVCIPATGADLVDRDSLGDTNPDEWELYDNEPSDPWSFIIMFPVREEGAKEYHHVQASKSRKQTRDGDMVDSGVTNPNQLSNMYREAAEMMRIKPGMLPVVQFDEKKFSKTIKVPGRGGKLADKRLDWSALDYMIVDWVPVEACDRLNSQVALGGDGEDIDPGEGTMTNRVERETVIEKKAARGKVQAQAKATPAIEHKPAIKATAPTGKSKKKVADL